MPVIGRRRISGILAQEAKRSTRAHDDGSAYRSFLGSARPDELYAALLVHRNEALGCHEPEEELVLYLFFFLFFLFSLFLPSWSTPVSGSSGSNRVYWPRWPWRACSPWSRFKVSTQWAQQWAAVDGTGLVGASWASQWVVLLSTMVRDFRFDDPKTI